MATDKKAIVKEINTSFTENNVDGFLDHCTNDVVWTMVGEKTNTGKKAIREWTSQMEGMDPPKFTVDQMIADGDSVACFGEMTMKDEKGVEGKYSYCDAYTFTDDKVSALKSFVVKHKTEEETKKKAA